MDTAQPAVHFVNIEYFFRVLYDLIFAIHSPSLGGLAAEVQQVWIAITVLAYILSIASIGVLVYYSMRLYQIREEENQKYGTISEEKAHVEVEHSRWTYIRELIESPKESDWRAAIIEADIMLDEILSKQGYEGDSVGDKLKTANPSHFHTIQDAWDAHRVRNEIAHQGSEYQLSDQIAYRTIQHYENVFREFGEI